MPRPRTSLLLGAFGAGVATGRAVGADQVRFARMSGSSIARPDAASWITDFLNAAYYRGARHDVGTLRLAHGIITTRWHRLGHRRLTLADVAPFHRHFGRARFLDGGRSPRGTLDRGQLLEGAAALLGPWFPDAWADPGRRAWGIGFETAEERAAYDPAVRLRLTRLGPSSPPPHRPRSGPGTRTRRWRCPPRRA